ncbi:glycosyltransferase family 2 protein [Pelagibacterium limicola]|uniref:glycosyltransferase family 2 protein n=1 Tax=Pelagibacterium limicola TaxID=2791022 RepID=UPI0018AF6BAB|nr:glycosyltransferase [Pelagibacterium limicola]
MREHGQFLAEKAILEALLGNDAASGRADAILERAERLDCDPLTVFIHQARRDEDEVYRQVAALLGLAYVEDIAPFILPFSSDANVDALWSLSSVRGRMRGADVLFVAPGLRRLLALAKSAPAVPVVVTSPRNLATALATVNADLLASEAVQRTVRQYPHGNANTELGMRHRYGLVLAIFIVAAAALFAPSNVQTTLFPALATLLVCPSLFRLRAAFTARKTLPLQTDRLLGDEALPVYTVLIPLRDEAHMVPQLAQAMARFDYPAEKLDIKFVVESTSRRTVMAARRYLDDARFSVVVVPRRPPYTKPKALNFALPFARGRHVTVFDAEDVPDRQQLRKAATLFARHPEIACLQAHLLITNADRNWLTRMFAAEYAGHFGVLLPAIARAGLPVPLGGTSNHFRTDILKSIGGWDAFNVTEDADLGIRIGRLGHGVETFASFTSEESPVAIGAWLRQRSRWMKGWMQTVIVHNAHPKRLLDDLGWRGLIAFETLVGGMVLSISIHGLMLAALLVHLTGDLLWRGAPDFPVLASLGVLGIGYAGAILVSAIGLARIGRRDLVGWLVLLPIYWFMMWLATAMAAIELLRSPYSWAKTHHSGAQASHAARSAPVAFSTRNGFRAQA